MEKSNFYLEQNGKKHVFEYVRQSMSQRCHHYIEINEGIFKHLL